MRGLFLVAITAPCLASAQFALKNGDRVVFYGDSITDQQLYTADIEAFVRTRFPNLKVMFFHSGWAGDRVTGGQGGDIDTRLTRDVLAYRPTMVTVMLGMNDAGYRPFDRGLFDAYTKGYAHIVERLKKEAPKARLTLLRPSPFDDVTRSFTFEGGYNAVLVRYGDYVKQLGMENGATVADLNSPVVAMLQKANVIDPARAQQILPDRIHPGDAGALVLAEALLKAWNAPSVVSLLAISDGQVTSTANTRISQFVSKSGKLSWTQKDDALPFALNMKNALTRLVVESSDFFSALNQQTLTAKLPPGRYALSIDGATVGVFGATGLAKGLNLAPLETPMRAQAQRVAELVKARIEMHNQRWRMIQTNPLYADLTVGVPERDALLQDMDRYDAALDVAAREAAKPVAHRFALVLQP